jgi:FAD/FMN-containing dehydrogenase
MDRRHFCQATLATGLAAFYPFHAGCGRSRPARTVADTNIAAVSLDGAAIELEKAAINELAGELSGPLLLPGHPEFDGARKIWNGMHDRRPALIARCANAKDVSHAVTFARERGLLTAVRGGGHSWPGHSVCERGLVIDLSQMNAVAVDPVARRATAGGGALLHALDNASLAHGLATTTGVVSHTGVGGYTLGGGLGNLNRKFGLAIDNLLSARLVTADGQIRAVSADEDADLFWAIRGGGGNFGVVTEFECRLHPFDRDVLSGGIVWPFSQARDVLEFYAEWSAGLSDAMYVSPGLVRHPEFGDVVVMGVVYNGNPAAGEKELAPLRRVGKPAADGVVVQDHMVMQTMRDGLMHHGIRSYAKNGMVKEWTQPLVNAIVEAWDPRLILGSHVVGGAVNRVGETDTAFPHRNAAVMLGVVAIWDEAGRDQETIAAAREYYAALERFTGGYYDNIEFEPESVTGNYGPAFERLAEIKARHDPMNLFRLNSNILPAT